MAVLPWGRELTRGDLVAWRLHEGVYLEEAAVSGGEAFHFSIPVAITIVPADLLRPLHG